MPKYHVSSALPRLARPRGPRLGPLSAVVCQRSRHSQGNRTPIVKARSKLQYRYTYSIGGRRKRQARARRGSGSAPCGCAACAHTTATVYQLPASLNTQVKKKQSKKNLTPLGSGFFAAAHVRFPLSKTQRRSAFPLESRLAWARNHPHRHTAPPLPPL
jgi:hypothetical protein